MRVDKTTLDRVLLVTPDIYHDHRGSYTEIYNSDLYYSMGIPQDFIQDDISISHKNVLRGIHGDNVTWKLVSCPVGAVFLAVVNWMSDTPQFMKSATFILSDINHQQVLIPPGFGNGHLVISDKAVFHYKQSTYYNPYIQFSIPYNDPKLGIDWPLVDGKPPITSERDKGVDLGWLYMSGALYDNTQFS